LIEYKPIYEKPLQNNCFSKKSYKMMISIFFVDFDLVKID